MLGTHVVGRGKEAGEELECMGGGRERDEREYSHQVYIHLLLFLMSDVGTIVK